MIPLTWTEIWSWSQATGTRITATEARALIDLSREYVKQYVISRDPLCPAPVAADQATVIEKVKAFARSCRRAQE